MKFRVWIPASFAALLSACGSDDRPSSEPAAAAALPAPAREAEPPAPQGPMFRSTLMGREVSQPLVSKELAPGGLPGLTIVAPESATVEESRFAGTRVAAPAVNYSVSIRQGELTPEATTAAWNALDPEGNTIEQSENLMIRQGSGTRGFLFVSEVTVNGQAYTCGSSSTAFSFDRNQVDQMIESCRSIAAAP